jgi:DNA-binding MarR family transcriptional regulator
MAKSKSGAKGGIAALDQSPSHLLHRALQRALDIYAETFGDGGVTQRQFAVLAAADEHAGATQADLVRITGIDRSTLADMARRMIGKNLLERERSNVDARANAVRLTDTGRAALAEARPKMAAADARLLKLISGGGRRAAFVGLLRELAHSGAKSQAKAEAAAKPKPAKKSVKPHGQKSHAHKSQKGGKKAKKKAA